MEFANCELGKLYEIVRERHSRVSIMRVSPFCMRRVIWRMCVISVALLISLELILWATHAPDSTFGSPKPININNEFPLIWKHIHSFKQSGGGLYLFSSPHPLRMVIGSDEIA